MLPNFQAFYKKHYYKIIAITVLILWTLFVFGLGLALGLLQKEEQLIFKAPPGAQVELGPEFFDQMRQLFEKELDK
jgi:uncharacterized protein (DUF58 family)